MKNERFSIKFISARRIFVVGYILCSFIEVSVSTVYDGLQSVDCVEACDGESQIAVVNSEMWVGTLTWNNEKYRFPLGKGCTNII